MVDLNIINNKNDLHHLFWTIKMKNTNSSNSCIYINIIEVRQNCYLKLISTINNLQTTPSIVKRKDFIDDDMSQPILTFYLKSNHVALNDWDNVDFFSFNILYHFLIW